MTALPASPLASGAQHPGVLDLDRWLQTLGLEKMDAGWVIFGVCAQGLIATCFVVHLIASRRRRRIVIPPALGLVGLAATVMLLVYAVRHRDPVFIIGQVLNGLICLRLLSLIRRARRASHAERAPGFPLVAPELVERKSETDEDANAS